MKLSSILTVGLIAGLGISCSTKTPEHTSTTAALSANSAIESAPLKPFGKHTLAAGGAHYLNDFIRPDIRARLDEEPTGDADSGYDPGARADAVPGEAPNEPGGEQPVSEDGQPQVGDEDSYPAGARLDSLKFAWAKKGFGDAIKPNPGSRGVIVLYADENHYDVERLISFVEEGRARIAEMSEIDGGRIEVVFGGYRAVPQVELWVIPEGGAMPEFKTDDRAALNEPAG